MAGHILEKRWVETNLSGPGISQVMYDTSRYILESFDKSDHMHHQLLTLWALAEGKEEIDELNDSKDPDDLDQIVANQLFRDLNGAKPIATSEQVAMVVHLRLAGIVMKELGELLGDEDMQKCLRRVSW